MIYDVISVSQEQTISAPESLSFQNVNFIPK